MLIRGLPLYAGIAPILATTLAYWLGAGAEALPSCVPPIDGCTSISATGRNMPGSLVFRAVMLPQAAVLAFLWHFGASWLQSLEPQGKSQLLVRVAGFTGALALVLYLAFLGTKTPFYDFMRRFGVYFYFLGTAVAQVTLALATRRIASVSSVPELRQIAIVLLWLCMLPFALGILNLVLKSVLADPDFVENRIEWIAAILMQAYFIVLYFAWRQTGFDVAVTTD